MQKRSIFTNRYLPYLLVAPQFLIVFVFFFWPAGEAFIQSFQLTDPFGQHSHFVGFENFVAIFSEPEYRTSFSLTLIFSLSVTTISVASGLFLAVLANRARFAQKLTRTLLIWPYAVAPAVAGILYLFIFHPTYGALGRLMVAWGLDWNPVLNGAHAMIMVIVAASWKQISYNFVFFLGGLQSIPRSIIEAAAIDGAGPLRRFFVIGLPMLTPTQFFLLVMNLVYAFFETFGVIHATTQGGPGGSTATLVYKAYTNGFVGQNFGSSAAQSVVLMVITVILTVVQFRVVEKKVHYG